MKNSFFKSIEKPAMLLSLFVISSSIFAMEQQELQSANQDPNIVKNILESTVDLSIINNTNETFYAVNFADLSQSKEIKPGANQLTYNFLNDRNKYVLNQENIMLTQVGLDIYLLNRKPTSDDDFTEITQHGVKYPFRVSITLDIYFAGKNMLPVNINLYRTGPTGSILELSSFYGDYGSYNTLNFSNPVKLKLQLTIERDLDRSLLRVLSEPKWKDRAFKYQPKSLLEQAAEAAKKSGRSTEYLPQELKERVQQAQ